MASDPQKPYGDVTYADPGYQEDGKARYPLSDEEKCRSAWSYINQAGNAAKYSPEQLKHIKARIMAAGKKYGITFADQQRDAALDDAEERFRFRHGWIPIGGSKGQPDHHAAAADAVNKAASLGHAREAVRGLKGGQLRKVAKAHGVDTHGTDEEVQHRLVDSISSSYATNRLKHVKTRYEAEKIVGSMKGQHLTAALKARNLSTSGTLSDMRQRLLASFPQHAGRSVEDGEYRRVPDTCTRGFDFEMRSASGDGRTIEGYVAMFGSVARIPDRGGDFDEELHPGFADRSLAKGYPVMQWDHGKDPRVGTVPIGVYDTFDKDSRGYYVRGRLFDNAVVEPVRQAIEGKAVKGMSFRFSVKKPGGDRWNRRSMGGGVDKRDILDADVHEAGPVVFPAYAQTSVTVRSLLASASDEERAALIEELADAIGEAVELPYFTGQWAARSDHGGENDDESWEDEASTGTTSTEARARQLAMLRNPILLP